LFFASIIYIILSTNLLTVFIEKDLVSIDLKTSKKKGMRRWIFEGWNNWSDFEKAKIQIVKDELLKAHGIEFNTVKDFGPRFASKIYVEG